MFPKRIAFVPLLLLLATAQVHAEFRAGATVVSVTPEQFPVLVNGGMYSRESNKVKTPVNARAIVLDDGKTQLAIVVVDSCMIPRAVLDDVKGLAAGRTGIQPDHILISSTHTHTAPSSMSCLGTDADPNYIPLLRERVVAAIAQAQKNLEPARIGWAKVNAADYTALRRWVRRPDRLGEDPFGNPTVRANMHAAANPDDVTGESGPEDPDLSVIGIQAKDGRSLALLANFSMHYFGDEGLLLSADYFGLFSEGLKAKLAPETPAGKPDFVAAMSHGCSGDIWRRDYSKPDGSQGMHHTIQTFADGMIELAAGAFRSIEYRDDIDLAMAEARLPLKYRVPDRQRLEWAQKIVAEMGDRLPKTLPEVYAREQIKLHEWQQTEVVVQAIRIGDIAIATTPTETYALTGLKIKAQSPLAKTFVIELANGGDGYIPPPEQHPLGGYNTWPARSAGLEVQAEPKIAEAAVELLETVAGKPRRKYEASRGAAAEAILKTKPAAYWRLDEFAASRAVDSTGNNRDAIYEPGVLFFLEGPKSEQFCTDGDVNRAAHFAGGRLQSRIDTLGENYSVSLWIWNGMPVEGRDVTGWFVSRGRNHGLGLHGDHLGLGGTASSPGKLIFLHGGTGATPTVGKNAIDRWTWNHVVLVREGSKVRVYLNGNTTPEIDVETDLPESVSDIFLGGRSDNDSNWEGRLDEIAVFDRALTADEVAKLAANK